MKIILLAALLSIVSPFCGASITIADPSSGSLVLDDSGTVTRTGQWKQIKSTDSQVLFRGIPTNGQVSEVETQKDTSGALNAILKSESDENLRSCGTGCVLWNVARQKDIPQQHVVTISSLNPDKSIKSQSQCRAHSCITITRNFCASLVRSVDGKTLTDLAAKFTQCDDLGLKWNKALEGSKAELTAALEENLRKLDSTLLVYDLKKSDYKTLSSQYEALEQRPKTDSISVLTHQSIVNNCIKSYGNDVLSPPAVGANSDQKAAF
jgi:hypothetical protein